MLHLHSLRLAAAPLFGGLLLLPAIGPGMARPSHAATPVADRAPVSVHRELGPTARLGDGTARTYVVMNPDDDAPMEVGVALDEGALNGLPDEPIMLRLTFPEDAPAPYTFVLLDWNPHGHEPPGVYDVPHYDFHFYTVPQSDVDVIVPDAPDFASAADRLPTGDYVPAYYSVLTGPGQKPADVAVPMMGVHWVDGRSPELQKLFGHPDAYRPFDATFIYGSWNGDITFVEPMITRAYLLQHGDETRDVPRPKLFAHPGWYPEAYRVRYDAAAHEYQISLQKLGWEQ